MGKLREGQSLLQSTQHMLSMLSRSAAGDVGKGESTPVSGGRRTLEGFLTLLSSPAHFLNCFYICCLIGWWQQKGPWGSSNLTPILQMGKLRSREEKELPRRLAIETGQKGAGTSVPRKAK